MRPLRWHQSPELVVGEARGLLRGRRLAAYLFAAPLKHLNRDNCVPPNEELGRGKLPIDLLHTNGNRTELSNRVGPEPEPHANFLDNGSLYRPPAGLVCGRGADYEPCVVVVEPDGNFLWFLVHYYSVSHHCVSAKVLGKVTEAAEAAIL